MEITREEIETLRRLCAEAKSALSHQEAPPIIRLGYAAREWLPKLLDAVEACGTPSAHWREKGEADPHNQRYDCERSKLIGGDMTDDEVANAVYLDPCLMNLEAAKDRIRWLSRQLVSDARGWRPIAAAPGDGSSLLIAEKVGDRWHVLEGHYVRERREWYGVHDYGDEEFSQPYEPTHWMPLPAPPADEETKKT